MRLLRLLTVLVLIATGCEPGARPSGLASAGQLGDRTEPPALPTHERQNTALFVRGPLSLHALRLLVGDTVFFGILQTWTTRFHRSAAHVDDFVALAEEVSGRSLANWAQRWLREEAVPPISELGLKP